jgi:hypothetical protein
MVIILFRVLCVDSCLLVVQLHFSSAYKSFSWIYNKYTVNIGAHSSVVVKALCYKPEGHGFETWWSEWIFFNLPHPSGRNRPWSLLSLYRNEYQKQKNYVSGE